MATLKINVMSIVAIILMVAGVIAVALYEAGVGSLKRSNLHNENTYEAMLIIAIILALVVLIVTCMDVERVTGKTFLIYALAALLLVIGIICLGVDMGGYANRCTAEETLNKSLADKLKIHIACPRENYFIASIVFACVALLAAVAGAVAPFVCNK